MIEGRWKRWASCLRALAALGFLGLTNPAEVVLSRERPRATFPLDQEKLAQGETIVVLRIVRVENPEQADFSIPLELTGCRGAANLPEVPLGALALFPSSATEGSFAFDLGPALKKIPAGYDRKNLCLQFELKLRRPEAGWEKLRVRLSPPIWKAELGDAQTPRGAHPLP